jgi:predicted nuclease of restriction endonuclease-like (RecB) superfamily
MMVNLNISNYVDTVDAIELDSLQAILSIENQNNRDFYIAETVKNNCSVRQLERQIPPVIARTLFATKQSHMYLKL